MSWWNGFWLSITTATTVGYGDISADTHWGQLATFLLMYIVGISLLAQLASEYFEHRIELRHKKLKGLWNWKDMQEHILIINTPKNSGQRYFDRLIEQINLAPALKNLPIQILSTRFPDGLPKSLCDSGVVHTHGRALEKGVLQKANVLSARFVFVVARDEDDIESDCLTLDILNRLSEIKTRAMIIVEAVDDENRERFKSFGADAILRPVRAYPEVVVRAMEEPGTEEILENLFTQHGDLARRIDLDVPKVPWYDIIDCVVKLNLGLPLAYVDSKKRVVTNPDTAQIVEAVALIILSRKLNIDEERRIIHAVQSLS